MLLKQLGVTSQFSVQNLDVEVACIGVRVVRCKYGVNCSLVSYGKFGGHRGTGSCEMPVEQSLFKEHDTIADNFCIRNGDTPKAAMLKLQNVGNRGGQSVSVLYKCKFTIKIEMKINSDHNATVQSIFIYRYN